jgi:hypothetical protein
MDGSKASQHLYDIANILEADMHEPLCSLVRTAQNLANELSGKGT